MRVEGIEIQVLTRQSNEFAFEGGGAHGDNLTLVETGETAALDSTGSYMDAAWEVKQVGGADRRKEKKGFPSSMLWVQSQA